MVDLTVRCPRCRKPLAAVGHVCELRDAAPPTPDAWAAEVDDHQTQEDELRAASPTVGPDGEIDWAASYNDARGGDE